MAASYRKTASCSARPSFSSLQPPAIEWQAVQQGADCVIRLTSKAFAWGVWLETGTTNCLFSDNSFFLLPGESKTVIAYGITAGKRSPPS